MRGGEGGREGEGGGGEVINRMCAWGEMIGGEKVCVKVGVKVRVIERGDCIERV